MSWFRAESSLRTHPKIVKLARRLGVSFVHALGHMTCLWSWVCETAQDGNVSAYDAEDMAIAAQWEGDAESFLRALIEVKLIDELDDELHVHDWMERAESFKAATRKRDQRAKDPTNKSMSQDSPETVPGQSRLTDGRTDGRDGEDGLRSTPPHAGAREDGEQTPTPQREEPRSAEQPPAPPASATDGLALLVAQWNAVPELERVLDYERYRSQWAAIEIHLSKQGIDLDLAIRTFVENAASSGIIRGEQGERPHKWALRHLLRLDRFTAVLNGEWSSKRGQAPPVEDVLTAPLKGGGESMRARARAIRQVKQAQAGPVVDTTATLLEESKALVRKR